MIARYLEESMTIHKSDNLSDIKAFIRRNYPKITQGLPKQKLDDFFHIKKSVFTENIDSKCKKIFSIFGKNWFALGRLAYYSAGLDSGYYQKVVALSFEEDTEYALTKGRKWNVLSSSMFDGKYQKCIGTKEDIPYMLNNMDILFKLLSRCGSSEAAFQVFCSASVWETPWRPVRQKMEVMK